MITMPSQKPEVLNLTMPDSLQRAMIQDFDRISRAYSGEEAEYAEHGRTWLKKALDEPTANCRHNPIKGCSDDGRILNSQIHPDEISQYLVTVSDTPWVSTIAFTPETQEQYEELHNLKTHDLFERNSNGLLAPTSRAPRTINYVQARSGQVLRLPRNVLHGAAPLYRDERKILVAITLRHHQAET